MSKDATATPLAPSISTIQPAASHSQTASRPVGQKRQQHLRKAAGTACCARRGAARARAIAQKQLWRATREKQTAICGAEKHRLSKHRRVDQPLAHRSRSPTRQRRRPAPPSPHGVHHRASEMRLRRKLPRAPYPTSTTRAPSRGTFARSCPGETIRTVVRRAGLR